MFLLKVSFDGLNNIVGYPEARFPGVRSGSVPDNSFSVDNAKTF
jgi:hypothetical protein